jgi:hypothetical protein
MKQKSGTLDQNNVVGGCCRISHFHFATRKPSWSMCEVMLHRAEASLQWLIVLVSFPYWVHTICFRVNAVFVAVYCSWWENFTQQLAFTIPEQSCHWFHLQMAHFDSFCSGLIRIFPSHGISFQLWGKLINPCFISHNDAVHKQLSFILVVPKSFKQSSQSFVFVLFGEHFWNPMSRHLTEAQIWDGFVNNAFCSNC